MLQALWLHPDGMSLVALAAEVNRTVEQAREALLAYYCADFAAYVPDLVARPDAIEFFGGSEDGDDCYPDPMVRLVTNEPGKELGVAYATAPELFRLYRAGRGRYTAGIRSPSSRAKNEWRPFRCQPGQR
jgi:hypothetical protein